MSALDSNFLVGLEQDLRRGRIRPVYLLLGPEDYTIEQALQLFRQIVVGPDLLVFNLASFEAESADMAEVLSVARTLPMMSRHRLVFITEIDRLLEGGRRVLEDYLHAPADRCVVVLTASEIDRRTGFFRLLKEEAEILECPRLKGPELERWVKAYLQGHGYRLSGTALKLLLDTVGSDLRMLVSEIEKIALCAGPGGVIPDAAVEEMAGATRQRGIFELTGAIGRRDVKGALRVLASLLDSGESSIGIVAMIARHYRQVLIAKEMLESRRSPQEIATAIQMPQFIMEDFLRQARSLDRGAVTRLYLQLAATDRRFKSESVDHRIVLESLICSL